MAFFEEIKFSPVGLDMECLYHAKRRIPRHYGIQYNHSGDVIFCKNDDKPLVVNGPWAFVTYPGTDYFDYGPVDNQPRFHAHICFVGPGVERYISRGLLPIQCEEPLIKINHPERFLQTVTELVDMIQAPVLRHDRAVHKLEDLMLQLHEQEEYSHQSSAYLKPVFEGIMAGVRHNPQKAWDFAQEASKAGLSMVHFRRLFKQFSGLPPQQFLIQCRLQAAAGLLTTSSYQINDIADRVGFDNEFYFSRLFKKKFNMSPLAYRRDFQGY